MRRCECLLVLMALWATAAGAARAEEFQDRINWKRIDSKYCTVWLRQEVEAKQVNKRINTWQARPPVNVAKSESEELKLAAKCDTIFQRAQEILDMFPPAVHTTLRIVKNRNEIEGIHEGRYGYGTEAVAFYDLEDNTIFVAMKDLSEGVLAHEMAHCIIDHYFRVRPPRKIEELLAMHVDEHLRD